MKKNANAAILQVRPGGILLSAGIPDLPIEMASARLLHKSNQENHPFCGSTEVVHNGLRGHKQLYKCEELRPSF